jgi:aminocarboxymuconate-semialdehyde decarboxylase
MLMPDDVPPAGICIQERAERAMPAPVIDVHSHFVPQGWPSPANSTNAPTPWLRPITDKTAMIMLGDKDFRLITSNCWDAQERVADMDADGIDMQVVSPTPVFFGYALTAADATASAQTFNDLCLALCAQAPDRLLPFCQVPLQDTDAACRELDRCLDNGHLGVEIGNHVGDRDLDDAGIIEFLQHCAARNAPVFVHPWDMTPSPRNQRWMAQWLVDMPAETHLSVLSMILGGVFDRISPDLRICFAHGGGSFAMWLGRMDNAWHQRPDVVGTSQQPPSYYVDRFSVDSVVFDPRALRLLTDTYGATQVMMGSDYPYPLGERPAGKVVLDADFLTIAEREAILGSNAERFLGTGFLRPPQLTTTGASA